MMTDINESANAPDLITASIEFSYFSSDFSCDMFRYRDETEILAHLKDSMVFKTRSPISPGATICMSVSHLKFNVDVATRGEEIPALRIAEVITCRALPDSDRYAFEIDVKYIEPCY